MKARLFQCPKCQETVTAVATEVAHYCRYNKNRMTTWDDHGVRSKDS